MSNYSYEAVDAGGLKIEGKLDVLDQNEALRRVKEMGLFPVRIVALREVRQKQKPVPGGATGKKQIVINIPYFSGRVKASALAVFTRQLATLIEAGMPLLRGLRILREQEESLALGKILDQISEGIEGGGSLSEALAQHPRVFNKLYVNMVKAGELSGALELTLRRLAEFMEKAQRIKGKVKAAMFYPISVLIIAFGILMALMAYVVPKFQEVLAGLNIQMPKFTLFVFGLSSAIKGHLLLLIGGMVLAAFMIGFSIRTKAGRRIFDGLKLHAPVFGPIFRKSAISRFSRTLGTLLGNGVPILQALDIVRDTAGNTIISQVVATVHESVKQGETVAAPLRASSVFPAMVAGMVDIGEQTGALPDMLMKVADNYDDQVDNAVTSMTSLLEPIMIVFLALIVGSIVVALFLPILNADSMATGSGDSE
jgi:type IV pilus assembly protein PilC